MGTRASYTFCRGRPAGCSGAPADHRGMTNHLPEQPNQPQPVPPLQPEPTPNDPKPMPKPM